MRKTLVNLREGAKGYSENEIEQIATEAVKAVRCEEKRQAADMEKVKRRKSSVDKWIGVIEGAELGDWKGERRDTIEGKP